MKRLSVLIVAIIVGISSLWAQESGTSLSASVSSDSVLMGHVFSVTFTLKNVDAKELVLPSFDDFEVVGGPNFSNRVSIVNGAMEQSSAQTFYLKPRRPGDFFIHPATAMVDGQFLETYAVPITVWPNPDGIEQKKLPEESNPLEQFNFGASPFQLDWNTFDFSFPDFPDFPDLKELEKELKGKMMPEEQQPAKKRKTYKL
ncbi:MAG TPA: BatD family protein [Saprospiraceae bacterium]|nr:BatD family protein [Saprospiraceae bacterium]HMQ81991.1 BatD family protein [Saprospiraceae bacterium]